MDELAARFARVVIAEEGGVADMDIVTPGASGDFVPGTEPYGRLPRSGTAGGVYTGPVNRDDLAAMVATTFGDALRFAGLGIAVQEKKRAPDDQDGPPAKRRKPIDAALDPEPNAFDQTLRAWFSLLGSLNPMFRYTRTYTDFVSFVVRTIDISGVDYTVTYTANRTGRVRVSDTAFVDLSFIGKRDREAMARLYPAALAAAHWAQYAYKTLDFADNARQRLRGLGDKVFFDTYASVLAGYVKRRVTSFVEKEERGDGETDEVVNAVYKLFQERYGTSDSAEVDRAIVDEVTNALLSGDEVTVAEVYDLVREMREARTLADEPKIVTPDVAAAARKKAYKNLGVWYGKPEVEKDKDDSTGADSAVPAHEQANGAAKNAVRAAIAAAERRYGEPDLALLVPHRFLGDTVLTLYPDPYAMLRWVPLLAIDATVHAFALMQKYLTKDLAQPFIDVYDPAVTGGEDTLGFTDGTDVVVLVGVYDESLRSALDENAAGAAVGADTKFSTFTLYPPGEEDEATITVRKHVKKVTTKPRN